MSHLSEMSNITTRANNQFPRPDFHRLDKQPYRLQPLDKGDFRGVWTSETAIRWRERFVGRDALNQELAVSRHGRKPAEPPPCRQRHIPSSLEEGSF